MGATSKQRTPSRCREWERERRNKFNQAIVKLGELIKTASRENDSSTDGDNIQYPKVEVIQRAIVYITDYAQEKSKLKAEVLALQVKLDEMNTKVLEKKDVGTQISKCVKTKLESSKYNKFLMLKKCKHNALKGKPRTTAKSNPKKTSTMTTTTETTKSETQATPISCHSLHNLPKLVPKSTKSKGPENTIVMVAATPYLIPQRPLMYPAPPPTFLLLNPSSVQSMNKTSNSVLNRGSSDITRTTMVNILPISAYSRPLSASKLKKNNVKQKTENVRKKLKPIKKVSPAKEDAAPQSEGKTSLKTVTSTNLEDTKKQDVPKSHADDTQKSSAISEPSSDKQVTTLDQASSKLVATENPVNHKPMPIKKTDDIPKIKEIGDETKESNTHNTVSAPVVKEKDFPNMTVPTEKNCKLAPVKDESAVDKNKLSNILESTLCENAVDGGNARLELAEELLAASPTAAFLMSFPLVSGNRADSPAEEPQNVPAAKDNNQRRNYIPTQPTPYFEKPNTNNMKEKPANKQHTPNINMLVKDINPHKFADINTKQVGVKTSNSITVTSVENPFLNLPMPASISTSCTLADPTFVLDFDCNNTKTVPSQTTSYANNSIFYKSDPFNSGKSAIYSTSSISSGHDFNSLGLYPCAMEKYSSKSKTDYSNVEENLMKIGSSRLTYDIDLGWSHKGFDFVNCTTNSSTFTKDSLLTTSASNSYTTSYNPFNPEFHVPLVSSTTKKDNISKPSSSFVDTIASFYTQTSNLWSEEMPFYTSNSISTSKTFPSKHQNYLPLDHVQTSVQPKQISSKQYEAKQVTENCAENIVKTPSLGMSHQVSDKYTKKSPSKMHINWMTSETRPMQNSCNTVHTGLSDVKDHTRLSYTQMETGPKKQDQTDGNYFPISIHTYPAHATQEEFQVWPSARPLGTTEISIDPPPINLPTLVGDLALGPHDKKRQNAESHSRVAPQADIQQNCGNFLSVTQLMNRSTDMSSRYHATNEPEPKPTPAKQNSVHYVNEYNRKLTSASRLDTNLSTPCYSFNDTKGVHSYDAINQFTNTKVKSSKSTDKSVKNQKHSYSAEALIRGNTYTHKLSDSKFVMTPQKYNDCNPQQDTSVAQVSHFPPIIDYVDNSYPGQQFSGTSIYNSTTNTISNTFYSNFMPGSSNLMASNYTGAPFSSEFMDYNQTVECNNYPNQKYEEFKIKGNPPVFHHEKGSNSHKSSKRDFIGKHKMDCSKKDSNKKYQSKRPKLSIEVEDWNESGNLPWQNKTPSKRHPNLMSEELSFPNYMSNQVPTQYQPDIFNSHLMAPNVQSVGHNVDRSLTSFPPSSRANFNLSTLFPEITMKVQ